MDTTATAGTPPQPVGGIVADQYAADAEWHESMAERVAALLSGPEPRP